MPEDLVEEEHRNGAGSLRGGTLEMGRKGCQSDPIVCECLGGGKLPDPDKTKTSDSQRMTT